MDCSLPGSSVHEIFQARVPEWGAIALGQIWPATVFVWPKGKDFFIFYMVGEKRFYDVKIIYNSNFSVPIFRFICTSNTHSFFIHYNYGYLVLLWES